MANAGKIERAGTRSKRYLLGQESQESLPSIECVMVIEISELVEHVVVRNISQALLGGIGALHAFVDQAGQHRFRGRANFGVKRCPVTLVVSSSGRDIRGAEDKVRHDG